MPVSPVQQHATAANSTGALGDAAAATAEAALGAPSARLFDALLAALAAVALGRAFAGRVGGGTGLMGFFVERIALPVLAFNVVASADLESFDRGVLAACALGKLGIFALALLVAIAACPGPPLQRAREAAALAFLAVASDDLAVGLPVLDALRPPGLHSTREYAAASAAISALLFLPLCLVAQPGQEAEGESPRRRGPLAALGVAASSSLVWCPLLGLLYKASLVQGGWGSRQAHLPPALAEAASLLSAPFVACSLFLTGGGLGSPAPSTRSLLLSACKVFVGAGLCGSLGAVLVGQESLRSLPLAYGALPTGGALLWRAAPLSGAAAEAAPGATLFSLVLACPVLLCSALFQDIAGDSLASAHLVLAQVQLSASGASVAAGLAALGLVVFLAATGRGRLCWSPLRQLLLWYVCVGTAGQVLMLAIRPGVHPDSAWCCEEFNAQGATRLAMFISWCQNSCRLLLLLMQALAAGGAWRLVRRPWLPTALAVCCLVVGRAAAALVAPSGVQELCRGQEPLPRTTLVASFTWLAALLLSSAGLAMLAWRRGAEDEDDVAQTDSAGSGSESEPTKEDGFQLHVEPRSTVAVITAIMFVRLLFQIANASQVLWTGLPMGYVPQAVVFEAALEQGQLVWLLLAAAFDAALSTPWAEAASTDVVVEDGLEMQQPLKSVGAARTWSASTLATYSQERQESERTQQKGNLCLVVTTTIYEPGAPGVMR